jgi:hypothetical protein
LNHIRPEHLLSFQEYIAYIKQLPAEVSAQVPPNLLKLSPQKFQYISYESWTSIFYQIIKIFYLSRVNPKMMKSIKGMPSAEKTSIPTIPDYYLEGSNLISPQEACLLYWMEVHYEQTHQLQYKRICNFDTQLADGIVFAAVIQSYLGAVVQKELSNLKHQCTTEDDCKFNNDKVRLSF